MTPSSAVWCAGVSDLSLEGNANKQIKKRLQWKSGLMSTRPITSRIKPFYTFLHCDYSSCCTIPIAVLTPVKHRRVSVTLVRLVKWGGSSQGVCKETKQRKCTSKVNWNVWTWKPASQMTVMTKHPLEHVSHTNVWQRTKTGPEAGEC